MAEKSIMKKETLLEMVFVFAFIAISIFIIASIRFVCFHLIFEFGAEAVCPFFLAVVLLFLAVLAVFKPFEKRYVFALIGITVVMLGSYCIANPSCASWDQIIFNSGNLCKSSTTFWLMLTLIVLSLCSTLILALKFFKEKYPWLLSKLK